jgi:hypothetical protein
MVKSLSNNTGALVAGRYKWDQFEVDAGYTWSRQANPSDSFPSGFPTTALGIFVPTGFVNSTNYNVNRLLNTIWLGGKYDIWSNLTARVGLYYEMQNDYLRAPAICTRESAT